MRFKLADLREGLSAAGKVLLSYLWHAILRLPKRCIKPDTGAAASVLGHA